MKNKLARYRKICPKCKSNKIKRLVRKTKHNTYKEYNCKACNFNLFYSEIYHNKFRFEYYIQIKEMCECIVKAFPNYLPVIVSEKLPYIYFDNDSNYFTFKSFEECINFANKYKDNMEFL